MFSWERVAHALLWRTWWSLGHIHFSNGVYSYVKFILSVITGMILINLTMGVARRCLIRYSNCLPIESTWVHPVLLLLFFVESVFLIFLSKCLVFVVFLVGMCLMYHIFLWIVNSWLAHSVFCNVYLLFWPKYHLFNNLKLEY